MPSSSALLIRCCSTKRIPVFHLHNHGTATTTTPFSFQWLHSRGKKKLAARPPSRLRRSRATNPTAATPPRGGTAAPSRFVAKRTKRRGSKSAPFGLAPVDYSAAPPPIAPMLLPPPPTPGFRKYAAPVTVLLFASVTVYFYIYNQNDAYEYWETMQTGGALIDDEDDDDDEEDEEE